MGDHVINEQVGKSIIRIVAE